jgi:hypothetical protein
VDLENSINTIFDFLFPDVKEDAKKEIKDYPGREKTYWAIICKGPWDMPEVEGCGRVYLSEAEYDLQMHPSMADKTWRCPICSCECWPDDEVMCGSDSCEYENEEDEFLAECINERVHNLQEKEERDDFKLIKERITEIRDKQEYFESLVNKPTIGHTEEN